MLSRSAYRITSVGAWRLVLLADLWSPDVEKKVLELVDAQPWAKHPQTLSFCLPHNRKENEFYLKVFHPAKGGSALKDAFRLSKAFRAWRQGIELTDAGFDVPMTVAAGEQRRFRLLRRAFILTQKIAGQPAPVFLRDLIYGGEKKTLALKRAALKRVAATVRQFHRDGFVHGDLVASNIFIAGAGSGGPTFYFMDNDRTRRYPSWLPQSLWKRNLIQLNRMPLPGITLQDRMRFFRAYLNRQELTSRERKLAQWLERKTRHRREECDGVDASGDFRKLMRWSREFSPPTDAGTAG
jgi:lipopolysaccharide kinase (Kdo/WaaP) family protein